MGSYGLFIKDEVLSYTSQKGDSELYVKIHDSIAVNDCQIGLFKKYKKVLKSNIFMKYSRLAQSGTFCIRLLISVYFVIRDSFHR